ncbi:nucleotidyltransferase domain-containing protein [soil metagenome]
MPVRSSTSSVFRWPGPDEVDRAARAWARGLLESHAEVLAVGYFGSYARGDHGVGSDLDLVVLLSRSEFSPERRSLGWPLESLPVPAEVLVYTAEEWRGLAGGGGRFYRMLRDETVWVCRRGEQRGEQGVP